ncbi:MAG: zinc metallopeptidase [Clostridia bacterium]
MLIGQISTFYMVVSIIAGLFLPVMIWMFYTSFHVNAVFHKYNQRQAESCFTARHAVEKVLQEKGMFDINIETCQGKLTDHFDPTNNTIYLSQTTADSSSVAALGVAMHELGHAMQYADNYAPVKIRTALVPAVNFTSKLSFPLILLSMFFEIFAYGSSVMKVSNFFLILALVCYGTYCIFTLITLPTEFNASKRAKQTLLDCNICNQDEIKDVSKVLSAAASTYVASFAVSLIQVARLLMILLSRRNDNN